jgi:hypothetical protein
MHKNSQRLGILRPLTPLVAFCLLFTQVGFSRVGAAGPQQTRSGTPVPGTPAPPAGWEAQPLQTAVPPGSGDNGSVQPAAGPQVVWAVGPSLSAPLRSIQPVVVAGPQAALGSLPAFDELLPKVARSLAGGGFDASIVQSSPVGSSIPAPSFTFDGISNLSGVLPPDAEGDIGYDPVSGKKFYMQWVNLNFQIWDVTNSGAPVSVYGPAYGNTLWTGFGGLCDTTNLGSPIVLFDGLANRWFASQVAWNGSYNDFRTCIAVSQTADPTGSWNRYDFPWDMIKVNHSPKFGLWPDGYYMSTDQYHFNSNSWQGEGVAVFNRAAMLAGAAANMIKFDLYANAAEFSGMLPSDLDGPAPAGGTPDFFTEWDNSTWLGDSADTLRIWNFHVDWTTPSNSTFGANSSFDPNQLIATSNVDPSLCGFAPCIRQPELNHWLDPLSDRLMYRMQFRNFGSYQTMVGNHSVDANGQDKAGIHWFELHRSGGSWSLYQEGVYAPGPVSRWMGSIAMDKVGDIALGYSVSSKEIYPSVQYTGRLVNDTLGELPQGESVIAAGAGAQTGDTRWGLYSMMAVDPKDDCTFWYTQEYYKATSLTGWDTRIGAFKFPSCNPIVRVYPPELTQSCLRPVIGADLALSDLMRTGGNFDTSTIALTFDGTNVTSLAAKLQSDNSPASQGSVFYTPPADLTFGPHQASLTYPRGGGSFTYSWFFTAGNIPCP